MIFLNPFALAFIPIILWIFRDIFLQKRSSKGTKLLLLALTMMLLALTRPAITNEISKEKFDANEYIIAIDASYSMQMQDIQPSRYSVAKRNITALLQRDKSDRFTLFAFTSNPLLIAPPTTDSAIVISALDALEPKFILTKGTSLERLFARVATLEGAQKSLLLFSDGGEEYQLQPLLNLLKSAAIELNVVAIASAKGAVVTKNGKTLKDENSNLVISRINPLLKELAQKSGGFYYELHEDRDMSSTIYSALIERQREKQELTTEVVSYRELFFIPLLLAFVFILLALTKAEKFMPLLSLLLITLPTQKLQASLLDFYYLDKAQKAYKEGEYTRAQEYYRLLSPSQKSYMALANSYYKNGEYKNALRTYSKIKSSNPHIKSILFYNMANAAFRLKEYERSLTYYRHSLNLEYSQEAYENMLIIIKKDLTSRVNVADMLPTKESKSVKNISKTIDNKKESENSGSNAKQNRRDASGKQGAAAGKSKKREQNSKKTAGSHNRFKMGYNAYELINKGYINEKHPW